MDILEQPSSIFYKDQGRKNNCLNVKLSFEVVPKKISVKLLTEDGIPVDMKYSNQFIPKDVV